MTAAVHARSVSSPAGRLPVRARRPHHDRLLRVDADLDALLELLEMAVTWHELDYGHGRVLGPQDWSTLRRPVTSGRVRERAEQAFALALDIVGEGAPGRPGRRGSAAPASTDPCRCWTWSVERTFRIVDSFSIRSRMDAWRRRLPGSSRAAREAAADRPDPRPRSRAPAGGPPRTLLTRGAGPHRHLEVRLGHRLRRPCARREDRRCSPRTASGPAWAARCWRSPGRRVARPNASPGRATAGFVARRGLARHRGDVAAREAGADRPSGRDFTVLAEVGAKAPGEQPAARRWPAECRADLDAGAALVVTEGRQSGTVGTFDDARPGAARRGGGGGRGGRRRAGGVRGAAGRPAGVVHPPLRPGGEPGQRCARPTCCRCRRCGWACARTPRRSTGGTSERDSA